MFKNYLLVCLCMILTAGNLIAATMDLSGKWQFSLDNDNVGISQKWFSRDLQESINLPGSCQEQGFGNIPSVGSKWTVSGNYASKIDKLPHFKPLLEKDGQLRYPFWWTPDRLYVGPAWYQKKVAIPKDWQGTKITLKLERVHWESQLWIDGTFVGKQNGIGVAQEYDLTGLLSPGEHVLTLCVDNQIKDVDIGASGHALSDQTQSNWNGIVGKIELCSDPAVSVENIRVDASDYSGKVAQLEITVCNITDTPATVNIAFQAETSFGKKYKSGKMSKRAVIPANSTTVVKTSYGLGKNAPLWNEFDPAIFSLKVDLTTAGIADSKQTTFGIRKIETDGPNILVNGRKIFLRGTLDCCIFPNTGYPPTDKKSWVSIFRIVKAHGLNHVRYHSWTPPKAAYEAADEVGVYLQPEFLMWVTFGDGAAVDTWIVEEAKRLFKQYGNHPSYAFMAIGNECHKANIEYMDKTIRHFKTLDPRRLYADNVRASWSDNCDFNIKGVKYFDGDTRGAPSDNTDFDQNKYYLKKTRPEIIHENGQWASWPNMAVEKKYSGSLHPYYLDVYRDLMKQAGIWERYDDYYRASGKLQVAMYKATIETALKSPIVAGMQLLDLRDFPGQGFAPIGVLDSFWETKGYCTADEYRSFCDETVPMARFKTYVWTSDQKFNAKVVVAHYGAEDMVNQSVKWKLTRGDSVIDKGEFVADIPTGTVTDIGDIVGPLMKFNQAVQLKLELSMPGTRFVNQWPIWAYPAKANAEPEGVLVAQRIDDKVKLTLKEGGSVLLTPPISKINEDTYGTFSPIFWTRVMYTSSRVHTLGAYCDSSHPALAEFPTETFADWQWFDLMENSKPIVMSKFPREIRPVVEPIDDWNNPRPLGLIFEAKVGKGKLLFCSIDITTKLDSRPAARQLRQSILSYMDSAKFSPKVNVDLTSFDHLFKTSVSVISGSYASAAAPNHELIKAMDQNPDTFWHSPWDKTKKMPQSITIDLGGSKIVKGVDYLPRVSGNDKTRVKHYEMLISDDAKKWQVVKSGTLKNNAQMQEIRIDEAPLRAKFVRFNMLKTFGGDAVSVAEIKVITE